MLSATAIFSESHQLVVFFFFLLLFLTESEKSEDKVIMFGKLGSIMTLWLVQISVPNKDSLVIVFISISNGSYINWITRVEKKV